MKSKFVYEPVDKNYWPSLDSLYYQKSLWRYNDKYYCMNCGHKGIWYTHDDIPSDLICLHCEHIMQAFTYPTKTNNKAVIDQLRNETEIDFRDKIVEILELPDYSYFGFDPTEENIRKIEEYFGVTIPDELIHDDAMGEIAEFLEKELKANGRYKDFLV